MGRRTAPTSQGHREDEMTIHSVLERCLAHGKYSRQDNGTILVIITIDIILITWPRVSQAFDFVPSFSFERHAYFWPCAQSKIYMAASQEALQLWPWGKPV